MGSKSGTVGKKLTEKGKRHTLKQVFGTCNRYSVRAFNHGEQTGLVERGSKLLLGVPEGAGKGAYPSVRRQRRKFSWR